MGKTKKSAFAINILFPCLLLSGLVGILTGTLVFFFKIAASFLIDCCLDLYAFLRKNLAYIPLLYIGLFCMAMITHFITKSCKCAKGGGIPTAVGILRGLITFKWLKNLIGTVFSAFASYISGLSLGEEGQCVQIGTCVGKGVSKLTGNKEKAWDRYIMTGGASSGFAVATGAPVSGIFFALEEAHKRFSPMIVMVALSSISFGYATSTFLGNIIAISGHTIDISQISISNLPLNYIWIPILIGIIVGFFSSGVTEFFKVLNHLWGNFSKIPQFVKIIIVFFLSGTIGLIIPSSLGGGIGLINALINREVVLWIIIILLFVKVFLSLFSNTTGVTGGMFIPTLCHGCLLGALIAELFIFMGIDSSFYLPIIIITMSSYLASVQRVPITALVFSMEAFNGFSNILNISIAVFLSYMIIEIFNITSLNDISLEEKLKIENKNRIKIFSEVKLIVQDGAFAVGKMVRDVFWPANCQVLSVIFNNEARATEDGDKHIHEGDTLHILYQKFDDKMDETDDILCSIVGQQEIKDLRKHSEKIAV